ncbi:MAG TPA: glycosyl hydrolase family 18 protein [Dehalococcoidia bacterium]|nr:glycosyl hydrolase family 18 protein [Dehalococcoidia bacterium]
MPRSEGPFDRLLKRSPERDPAPIIIGGTIAFLAAIIIIVLLFSSVFGGGDGGSNGGSNGGNGTIDIAPGIRGRVVQIPALPPGLAALSEYVEFEAEEDTALTIGLPLNNNPGEDPTGLGFYTHFDGRWQRLADVSVKQIEDRTVGEGDFTSVPENLAVLRVLSQTYQVAGALPSGATLHPDALVNIINPRDYTPAADGSVQGTKTEIAAQGALVMPTIVGSGAETGAVVNDILSDEGLRDDHVQAITDLVTSTAADGIDLEYSAVDVDNEGEFTDFVKALADSLHGESKRLSLTLPPPTDQREAYEWGELGDAVDIIRILPIADPVAYWETMPGAMDRLVEDVDPGKVMLVVSPFSIQGSGDVTQLIGYLQAMVQAAEAVVRDPVAEEIKPGSTVNLVAKNLDEGEGASPLGWSDDAAAVSYAIGGTDRRRIFIENKFSVAFKLELVQAYGLGGVAVSDASGQSDVANIWPTVNDFVQSNTVSLARPNDSMLNPSWQVEAGDVGAGAGTSATWIAPGAGTYNVTLVVSDGDRRFGRVLVVEVRQGDEASPTPLVTFPPEQSPTPTPQVTATATPTPKPGTLSIQVGKRADGPDADPNFEDPEDATVGSDVTFRIVIDNDSNVTVTIDEVLDDNAAATCDDVGKTLAPDDGDAEQVSDSGEDAAVCTYTITIAAADAPKLTNSVTVTVSDAGGNTGSDSDTARINIS